MFDLLARRVFNQPVYVDLLVFGLLLAQRNLTLIFLSRDIS